MATEPQLNSKAPVNNTKRTSMWNAYLPKNVGGGREGKRASKLVSNVSKAESSAPENLTGNLPYSISEAASLA